MTSRKLFTFTLTSIYRIRKYKRNRNPETRWKVVPRFHCSRLQRQRIKLISKTIWRKIRLKLFKRRIWLIHKAKTILILLLKNLSLQKVWLVHWYYCCRWWMKYTFSLFSTNWLTTWSHFSRTVIQLEVVLSEVSKLNDARKRKLNSIKTKKKLICHFYCCYPTVFLPMMDQVIR